MKKLFYCLLFTAGPFCCKAQSGGFLKDLSIGFPILYIDYCATAKSEKAAALPYGLNELFYKVRPSIGATVNFENFGARLLALLYKDKFGVEVYYSLIGANVNTDGFLPAITAQHPGYLAPTAAFDYSNAYQFSGFRYGVVYKKHFGRFIVEPKVQFGVHHLSTYDDPELHFQENGSNQFIAYNIYKSSPEKSYSYSAELALSRRVDIRRSGYHFQTGVHAAYTLIPYHLNIAITEQRYGMPATAFHTELRDVFKVGSAGIFLAFYWQQRAHKEPAPAKKNEQ